MLSSSDVAWSWRQQYMLQSDASLSDIAARCGFADQAHLCKAFRHAAGLSPALWRRMRRTHAERGFTSFEAANFTCSEHPRLVDTKPRAWRSVT
jgi:AraC-like DNA-binding protein